MNILGIDPRAKSADKIVPPSPLPHVSRRALARVKDRLEAPTDCPHCGECVGLVSNAEIYGRQYGKWPYAYLCSGCRAYVGLHPDTDLPLGTLADEETRNARKTVKSAFMQLVRKRFGGDRAAAYQWLAERMDISASECHFGFFDQWRCWSADKIIHESMTGRRARP